MNKISRLFATALAPLATAFTLLITAFANPALAAAIRPIYTAPSAEAAMAELEAFAQGSWGLKFPTVVAAWRRAWDRVIPFLPSRRPYAG